MFSAAQFDQKEKTDVEEKVTIDIDVQNFKCSITGQVFLEPVSTSVCGHTFEKSCIEVWCETNPTCPLCRMPIGPQNQLISASQLVMTTLQVFLAKNPKYNDERYFDLDLFISILLKGDSARLRNMMGALRDSDKLLNDLSGEGKNEGTSPLYHLLINKTGLQMLANEPQLRKNITQERLNAVIDKGVDSGKSIAYILAANEVGRQILLKDAELRRKITNDNLNRITPSGSDRGRSILYWLASTETGRKILLEDICLITLDSVNIAIPGDKSAMDWLKSTETGYQIISMQAQLSKKGKYIFDNGIMRLNPTHILEKKQDFKECLAMVSSMEDVFEAEVAYKEGISTFMQLADTTTSSIEIMQSRIYIDEFQSRIPLDSAAMIDGITYYLAQYAAPIGLINKLLMLLQYHVNIIISDDNSMNEDCSDDKTMTRWQAMENRMHQILDLLAYIPIQSISISFLNRKDHLILQRRGKSIEEFQRLAHGELGRLFENKPTGGTPFFTKLRELKPYGNTLHYFYLSGNPTDQPNEELKNDLKKSFTVTCIDCRAEEQKNGLETIQEYCTAIIKDFHSERNKARMMQGPSFPYTYGFWLISQLLAAISPKDLIFAAGPPFNKYKLDNLMGRKLTNEEYRYYFNVHPYGKRKEYQDRFAKYVRDDKLVMEELDSTSTQTAELSMRR